MEQTKTIAAGGGEMLLLLECRVISSLLIHIRRLSVVIDLESCHWLATGSRDAAWL